MLDIHSTSASPRQSNLLSVSESPIAAPNFAPRALYVHSGRKPGTYRMWKHTNYEALSNQGDAGNMGGAQTEAYYPSEDTAAERKKTIW